MNQDNYEKEVILPQKIFLVDFWGPRCRPCLALMPGVEMLEKEYAGKIEVGKCVLNFELSVRPLLFTIKAETRFSV
ncbi:thioredoxin family protein [Thermodesulfobacteriota bacterium]